MPPDCELDYFILSHHSISCAGLHFRGRLSTKRPDFRLVSSDSERARPRLGSVAQELLIVSLLAHVDF